mmetsp:Transcript_20195/g.20295  ORF Transcript_20195/g.20295 Transcript_20195/m.20295 type:complete len:662 (-) Transcript_20195:73-2058(-)
MSVVFVLSFILAYSPCIVAYSSSSLVEFGHLLSISNFEANEQFTREFWNSQSVDYMEEWNKSFLTIPIILLLLGIISIVFMNVGFLFRCCFETCKCIPSNDLEENDTRVEWVHRMVKKGRRYGIILLVICVLIVIVDQLILIANFFNFDDGISKVVKVIDYISSLFQNLNNDAKVLVVYGSDFESALAESSCDSLKSELSIRIDVYQQGAQGLRDKMSPLSSTMREVQDYVYDYITDPSIDYRLYSLLGVYAISLLAALWLLISELRRSKCGTQFSMVWAEFSFFIVVVLSFLWLLVMVLLANFCMDPHAHIVSVAPNTVEGNVTTHYVTCKGENELVTLVDAMRTQAESIDSAISSSSCGSDSGLVSIQATVQTVLTSLTSIDNDISCSPIQAQWNSLVEDALCTDIYNGLFILWISQIVCSFLLFIAIFLASMSYQFYETVRHRKIYIDAEETAEDLPPQGRRKSRLSSIISSQPPERRHSQEPDIDVGQEAPKRRGSKAGGSVTNTDDDGAQPQRRRSQPGWEDEEGDVENQKKRRGSKANDNQTRKSQMKVNVDIEESGLPERRKSKTPSPVRRKSQAQSPTRKSQSKRSTDENEIEATPHRRKSQSPTRRSQQRENIESDLDAKPQHRPSQISTRKSQHRDDGRLYDSDEIDSSLV